MRAFQPRHAATVNISVSASSQRIVIPGCHPTEVRVVNNGSATVWIEFGDSTVTAALATGVPIGPGVIEVLTGSMLSAGSGDLYVAAIAAGATGSIYFTAGEGI